LRTKHQYSISICVRRRGVGVPARLVAFAGRPRISEAVRLERFSNQHSGDQILKLPDVEARQGRAQADWVGKVGELDHRHYRGEAWALAKNRRGDAAQGDRQGAKPNELRGFWKRHAL
jgi:hypothetical protein